MIVVPPAAVTTPPSVKFHSPVPSIEPALQVTWVFVWVQDHDCYDVEQGGFPKPTTWLIWSVRTTLLTFAPPVFLTTIV